MPPDQFGHSGRRLESPSASPAEWRGSWLSEQRHTRALSPGPLSKSSVREVLLRRFYTGDVVYYGTDDEGRKRKREDYDYCVEGKHPALISRETFEDALVLRHFAVHRRRNEQGTPRLYPLSGIVRCAECQRQM
jgi:hypothetical protein